MYGERITADSTLNTAHHIISRRAHSTHGIVHIFAMLQWSMNRKKWLMEQLLLSRPVYPSWGFGSANQPGAGQDKIQRGEVKWRP